MASPNLIVVFGVSRLAVFKVDTFEVVEEMTIDGFIESANSSKGWITTLSTEEDG